MRSIHRNGLLSLCALALAAGAVGCGSNSVPENPSWARDIQPLMEAHCIRCHGGGGKLNGDPDVPPGSLKVACAPIPDGGAYTCAPNLGNFTTQAGLMTYRILGAKQMQTYLNYPMPPPPSEPLDDFETTLLLKWAANPLP
jgi:hypothetical protein